MPRAAIVQQLIGSYADAGGADIDFESIPYSDYFTRLGAALEAGSGPCVMQVPANILAEFQARGQLAPVPDSVMTAGEMESTFTPASIALLDIDGQYYGMPTDVQTFMLFYNDDLFEAAGLDPSKDFETWDDFRAAAIALTKMDGDNMSQAGLDITSSPYQWYYSAPTLAYEDGLVNDETLRVNYASEPGYQVWDRLTSLVTDDHVDSPEFLSEQSKFGSGLAGMTLKEYTFNGVYQLTAPDVNFSVHMPPPVADEQFAPVATTSWVYAVSSDCDNQDGAVELDPVPHVGGLTAHLDRRRRRTAVAPVAARGHLADRGSRRRRRLRRACRSRAVRLDRMGRRLRRAAGHLGPDRPQRHRRAVRGRCRRRCRGRPVRVQGRGRLTTRSTAVAPVRS